MAASRSPTTGSRPLHDGPTARADDDRKDARYEAMGLKHYRLR